MSRVLNNAKIGNILRFFALSVPHLPLMKALKLLYLVDELSFKSRGVSLTGLEYKAWKDGPVPKPVWLELRHGHPTIDPTLNETATFDDFLHIRRFENPNTMVEINIEARGAFDSNEFSRSEIKLMETVIAQYGLMDGYQLSQITHMEGGPWAKAVEANDLEKRFKRGDNTPDVTVDLVSLIADDDEKMEAYLASVEALQLKQHLMSYANNQGRA